MGLLGRFEASERLPAHVAADGAAGVRLECPRTARLPILLPADEAADVVRGPKPDPHTRVDVVRAGTLRSQARRSLVRVNDRRPRVPRPLDVFGDLGDELLLALEGALVPEPLPQLDDQPPTVQVAREVE